MGRMWQLHLNVDQCIRKEKLNLGCLFIAAMGGGDVMYWWSPGKSPFLLPLLFFFFPFPCSPHLQQGVLLGQV